MASPWHILHAYKMSAACLAKVDALAGTNPAPLWSFRLHASMPACRDWVGTTVETLGSPARSSLGGFSLYVFQESSSFCRHSVSDAGARLSQLGNASIS